MGNVFYIADNENVISDIDILNRNSSNMEKDGIQIFENGNWIFKYWWFEII